SRTIAMAIAEILSLRPVPGAKLVDTFAASDSAEECSVLIDCTSVLDSSGSTGLPGGSSDEEGRPSTQPCIHGGNEHECRKRREQQTFSARAGQWRMLFPAFSYTQCHGNHAQDHGTGGHQHWTQARIASRHRSDDG